MAKILSLDSWETPASHYKEAQVGNYRLKKSEYLPGYYSHYMMDGYAFVKVEKPIPLMLLQEFRDGEWHDWMADTPMDYTALQKMAGAAHGRVLTSGLGLALVTHELVKNPNVSEVTIVERSPEVVQLVSQYLPKEKVRLVLGDLWGFVEKDDTEWGMAIVDIWVTKGKEEHTRVFQEHVLPASNYMRAKYPNTTMAFHGFAEVTDVELVEPHPVIKRWKQKNKTQGV